MVGTRILVQHDGVMKLILRMLRNNKKYLYFCLDSVQNSSIIKQTFSTKITY